MVIIYLAEEDEANRHLFSSQRKIKSEEQAFLKSRSQKLNTSFPIKSLCPECSHLVTLSLAIRDAGKWSCWLDGYMRSTWDILAEGNKETGDIRE